MKKGLIYRIRKFKSKAKKYYLVNVMAYLGVFAFSIAGLVINLPNLNAGVEYKIIIFNVTISLVAFIIALIGMIKNIILLHRNYFNKPIMQQKEYKSELRESIMQHISISHKDSGFEWRDYNGQSYLVSDKVDEALFNNNAENLFIIVNPKKQAMDIKQKEAVYNIVSKKIAEGKSIFNSELVRLRTDILLSTFEPFDKNKFDGDNRKNVYVSFTKKLIVLEKTDYESNLTTNDLIYSTIYQCDYSDSYCGKDKTVDSRNTLYDLKDSPASNIIGVTTFAITSDGYLLLNLQGAKNDVNGECFVPSGSGSSDFNDLKNSLKYEPEHLRSDLETYKLIYDDKNIFGNPKEFKKIKRQYIDKLNGSEDIQKERIDYWNAEIAKLEQKGFKKYASKMKKYTYDFNTFLKYGMVRELIEESHLSEKNSINSQNKKYENITDETRRKYISNTYLCGYIRILDRGGKPDFFGFTLLDLTKDEVKDMFLYGHNYVIRKELKKNCTITDYNEISSQYYPSIDKIDKYKTAKEFIIKECNIDKESAKKVKVSLQTHCLFELLQKNKDKIMELIKNQ